MKCLICNKADENVNGLCWDCYDELGRKQRKENK